MKDDDLTALTKLVRHCGIRLLDAVNLEKESFDFTQKTILFKQRKQTRFRITTIRPDDVDWFKCCYLSGARYPCSLRNACSFLKIFTKH